MNDVNTIIREKLSRNILQNPLKKPHKIRIYTIYPVCFGFGYASTISRPYRYDFPFPKSSTNAPLQGV